MNNKHLLIEQLDNKFKKLSKFKDIPKPNNGWINNVRIALGMTLRQLGQRLNISAQSVRALELREENGSITLKNLSEAAKAINMELVYAIVPVKESLEKTIELKAAEKALEIIKRSSHNMLLEKQQNSAVRLKKETERLTDELKTKLPKYLWD